MSVELPPAAFSNAMNNIKPGFDFTNWRKSREWKIFVAGHNNGIQEAVGEVVLLRDMGTPKHKLYGEDQTTEENQTRPTRSKAVSKKSP